jgi:hypothetical protein
MINYPLKFEKIASEIDSSLFMIVIRRIHWCRIYIVQIIAIGFIFSYIEHAFTIRTLKNILIILFVLFFPETKTAQQYIYDRFVALSQRNRFLQNLIQGKAFAFKL